jgi:S1-C subfamily serine protease
VSSVPVRLPHSAAELSAQRGGLIVTGLEPGGPAETAGFLLGDVLLRLGGQKLESIGELQAALEDRAAESVPLTILRAGVVQESSVTPKARS